MKTLAILALAGLLGGGEWSILNHPSALQCDGPLDDPWVTDFRDQVMSHNELAHFALVNYGQPMACDGKVTSEFEGTKYGVVELVFPGGATLEVQTQPPETSIMTLTSPSGFVDAPAVRALIRRYTESIDLSIDWSTPEITMEDDKILHTFWDESAGLNAAASFILRDGLLVGVRISLAL